MTGTTEGVKEWKNVLWSTRPGGEALEECAQGERGSEQCSGNIGLTSHPTPPPSFYSSKHLLSTHCEEMLESFGRGSAWPPASLVIGNETAIIYFHF